MELSGKLSIEEEAAWGPEPVRMILEEIRIMKSS
jgi:hypothetical protein